MSISLYSDEDYTSCTTHAYKIGDRVMWRGAWGRDLPKLAVITGQGEENGHLVYDLDNNHWCYEHQIVGTG